MQKSKLWQYSSISKTGPAIYSGQVAIETNDNTKYDGTTPVNKVGDNFEETTAVLVQDNTLNGQTGASMKFKIAFKVHSSLFLDGSRYIITLPGLVSVMAQEGMLVVKPLWEKGLNPVYIPNQYIASGWNNLEMVGNGSAIKMAINTVNFTIYSSHEMTYYLVSGFNNSSYYQIADPFPWGGISINAFEIVLRFKIDTIKTSSIFGAPTTAGPLYIGLARSTAKNISYYGSNGGSRLFSGTGSTEITTGIYYTLKCLYDSATGYEFLLKKDGEDFITDYTSTSKTCVRNGSETKLNLGYSEYDTGAGYQYFGGVLDMKPFKISINGSDFINFENGVAIDEITTVGSLQEETDYKPWPLLNVGNLNTYQNSWLVLKDIEALRTDQ